MPPNKFSNKSSNKPPTSKQQSKYNQILQQILSLPETEVITYKTIIPQYLEDYGLTTPEQYIEFLDYVYTHLPKHRVETGVKVHKRKLQKNKLDKVSLKTFGFDTLEDYLASVHGDRYRERIKREQKYEKKLEKQEVKRKKEQLLDT